MKLKNIAPVFMALLVASSLFAAKSSSSSQNSCCKKTKKLVKQINRTTQQDLVVDQATLSVVNQINSTTRQDLVVDQEILDTVNHLVDCSCTCIVIKPEDFMDDEGDLTVTYVIREPGNYCLGADVAFAPIDEFTPAIQILSDNVRLDLRGFTLSQANDTPNAYGVQIGEGYNYNDPNDVLDNITVLNGTIRDFTAIGVFCYNASFDDETFDQVAFQDLSFIGLNILHCGSSPSFDFASGIDLDSSAGIDPTIADLPAAYRNVTVENCNVNNCVGNGALQFYTVDNVVVKNTQANDLTTEVDIFGTFAHTYAGRNIQMFDCQGNGASDFDPVNGSQAGGANIEESNGIYIQNCQFNDGFGESDFIVNSNLSENLNAVFENCQFNNNRGGESALIVAGVHASSALYITWQGGGIKWINCQFNASVSTNPDGLITTGFLSTCLKNMIFEDCQACNIQANGDFTQFVTGFMNESSVGDSQTAFSESSQITYRNCIVSDIQSNSSHMVAGYACFGGVNELTPEAIVHRNTVFENCIAERISCLDTAGIVAGISEANPYAFFPDFVGVETVQFDLFINACRVSDVRSNPGSDPSNLSAGIVVSSVLRPDIFNNSVSDCDRGILLTGTEEFGFSANGVIQDNEIDNCTVSCYEDDAPTTTSAWINNTAFNCGEDPSEFTNYDINFAGVRPVDAGTLSNYPVGGNKYYNLSLVP